MFEPMQMTRDHDFTIMTGAVRDQAQLHGLIGRIQDLGLELVSAEQIALPASPDDRDGTAA